MPSIRLSRFPRYNHPLPPTDVTVCASSLQVYLYLLKPPVPHTLGLFRCIYTFNSPLFKYSNQKLFLQQSIRTQNVHFFDHVFTITTCTFEKDQLSRRPIPSTTTLSRPQSCFPCGCFALLYALTTPRGCAGTTVDLAGIDLHCIRFLHQTTRATRRALRPPRGVALWKENRHRQL